MIFQQYLLKGKQWVGPNGERYLLPKSDGYGVIISSFQSREFGFGMDINDDELKQINQYIQGKQYVDTSVAINLNCTSYKNTFST